MRNDGVAPSVPRFWLRRSPAYRRVSAIRLRSLTLATVADRMMPRTRQRADALRLGRRCRGNEFARPLRYASARTSGSGHACFSPLDRQIGRPGRQGSSAAPSGGADDPRYVTMRFAHTIGTGQPTIPESGDSRSAGCLRRTWSGDGNRSHHVFVVLQSHTYGVLEWIGSDRRAASPRSSSRNIRRQLFPAAFGFASRGKKAVAGRLSLRFSLSGAG